MALHGSIEINHQLIGYWSAVRRSAKTQQTPDAVNVYDCEVHSSWNGEIYLRRFEVTHRYGDGAVALAARVLSRYSDLVYADLPQLEEV